MGLLEMRIKENELGLGDISKNLGKASRVLEGLGCRIPPRTRVMVYLKLLGMPCESFGLLDSVFGTIYGQVSHMS